jgi:hypothetical protein
MFIPTILAESDFNIFANAIELSDDWENHPAIADIVDVWHAIHQAETWGSIVTPIEDLAWRSMVVLLLPAS